MISLNKAFKDVYGERLRDRGYKKTKSKYPYLVRRVGDEIFHIITVIPTFSVTQGYKEFKILGGIGTVYRAEMPFDKNSKYFMSWLLTNRRYCSIELDVPSFLELAALPHDVQEEIGQFSINFLYEKTSDISLLESMRRSVDETEIGVLKGMEHIDTLQKCMEWYRKFSRAELLVRSPEWYRENLKKGGDSLLNFMLYSIDEYEAIEQEDFHKSCEEEKRTISLTTNVSYKETSKQRIEEWEESMRKRINNFAAMVSSPENMAWLEQELAARKKRNTELLESIMS